MKNKCKCPHLFSVDNLELPRKARYNLLSILQKKEVQISREYAAWRALCREIIIELKLWENNKQIGVRNGLIQVLWYEEISRE